MITDTHLLSRVPTWPVLLSAYAERQMASESGWVERIAALEGIEPDQISAIHGKLIAADFLDFELQGQAAGMFYRLTPLGRQALASGGLPAEEPVELGADAEDTDEFADETSRDATASDAESHEEAVLPASR